MIARSAVLKILKNRKFVKVVTILLAVAIVSFGAYLRLQPVMNSIRLGYGPTLYELDPYSEYWIAREVEEEGFEKFYRLTRYDPETHIFWYPWGRDFRRSALPLLPYFSVITYKVASLVDPNLTLYEWMVYLPVLFFLLSSVGIYLTVRELWGDAPALTAILAASLMFTSRHLAGFTVKYAIGLAFIFIATFFHVRAWKRGSFLSAVFAGVFLGLTAMGWAGFNLLLGAIALHLALLPLLRKVTKDDLIMWLLEAVPLSAVIIMTPFYGGYTYLVKSVGLVIPAITALMLIALGIARLSESPTWRSLPRVFRNYRLLYLIVIIVAVSGGIMLLLTGQLRLAGKALAAMGFGGLTHVIVETVQEYREATANEFIAFQGAALVASLITSAYLIYEIIAKKKVTSLFMLTLLVTAIYATANVSYFFSYTNYVVALVSAGFTYILVSVVRKHGFKRGWFASTISLLLLTFYVIALLTHGSLYWVRAYTTTVPTIIDSSTGLGSDIPAWIDALNWIKESTPEDAVVVAWWDYGYWISVVGERASVADGATLNVTQIEILAKALTSSEEEAARTLIRNFKIDPDKMYVMAYELYLVDENLGRVYIGPLVFGRSFLGGDAAKGIAAIYRIAGYSDEEMRERNLVTAFTPPGTPYTFYLPNWASENLTDALLFKVLLDAAYEVWGPAGMSVAFLYGNIYNPPVLPDPNMTVFKPAYISVSEAFYYTDLQGRLYSVYVVAAVYEYSSG